MVVIIFEPIRHWATLDENTKNISFWKDIESNSKQLKIGYVPHNHVLSHVRTRAYLHMHRDRRQGEI